MKRLATEERHRERERERERTKKRVGHLGVLEQESIGNSACDEEQQRGFVEGAERAGQH
jgi:hypothetical protein